MREGSGQMDAGELKAIQGPLKEKYRQDPQSALITLRAEGHAAGLVCKVETGKALVEAGLHPATGGDGIAACSGDMLLEALVACAGVTLRAVATAIGVEVQDARIRAEGDLDFRGTLGVAKDVPVGFSSIRLELRHRYERERGAGGHAPQTDRTVLRRPADAPVSAASDGADRSSGQPGLMVGEFPSLLQAPRRLAASGCFQTRKGDSGAGELNRRSGDQEKPSVFRLLNS